MRVKIQSKTDNSINKVARKSSDNKAMYTTPSSYKKKKKNIKNDIPLRSSIASQLKYEEDIVKNSSSLRLMLLNLRDYEIDQIIRFYNKSGISIRDLSIERERKIGYAGVRSLSMWTCLTSLTLYSCKLSCDECLPLSLNTSIKVLDLTLNNISCKGATLLSNNTTISKLNLSKNNIYDEGAKALAKNRTILALDLSRNKICTVGAMYLARNCTLENLSLGSNRRICDIAAEEFSKNTSIRVLSLARSSITHIGVGYIVSNNTRLRDLDLDSCEKIKDEGAAQLAKMHSLHTLCVSACNIEDKGCVALASSASIRYLDVTRNYKIGHKGAGALLRTKTLYDLKLCGEFNSQYGMISEAISEDTSLVGLSIHDRHGEIIGPWGDIIKNNRLKIMDRTKNNIKIFMGILPHDIVIHVVAQYVGGLDPGLCAHSASYFATLISKGVEKL